MEFRYIIVLFIINFAAYSADAETKIRLRDGRTPYMGRVEVFFDGAWGTVCDDQFDENDGRVVCRMLGYSDVENVPVQGGAYYGQGDGEVIVDELDCIGDETTITQCDSNTWGESDCEHSEDVGVSCHTHVELADEPTAHAGRLEISYQGVKRNVCSKSFGENDADVICRMLGYSTGNVLMDQTGMYGSLNGQPAITDLNCKGNELDISECSNSTLVVEECNGFAVGLDCRTNVRLVNGDTDQSGRVEIFYNDEWGTVCDDSFDDNDASVVCRMLGLNPVNAKAYAAAYFGEGNGVVVVDELECLGNETDITECKSNTWQSSNCGHHEDAGVECLTEIRIVDGPTPFSGRLEIHKQDTWYTVCDENFDNRTATVACNMLGFSRGNVTFHTGAYYGEGTEDTIDYDMKCFGNEADLVYCNRIIRSQKCASKRTVGINCFSVTPVRFVGGFKAPSGKVEVFYNNSWLSVCHQSYGFTVEDAQVICRMMGSPYKSPTIYSTNTFYDYVIREHGIGYLNCDGSETDISHCRSEFRWGQRTCTHDYSVGVNCDPVTPLRLVDGPSMRAGRVELLYNGTWGTVCNKKFNSTDGSVACRMLGYHDGSLVLQQSDYLKGNGQIVVSDVNCTGTEDDISNCKSSPWLSTPGCVHSQDVGVACTTKVRLVNGTNDRTGRVEVYHYGTWGTICADAFHLDDADVVCRMAGIAFWNATVLPDSPFGIGSIPVLIDDINCTGSEEDLSVCPSQPWQQTSCQDDNVASVDCHVQTTPLRLVSVGTTPFSGRVHVYHNNKWGTICAAGFTKANTDVVCRTLGYEFSSDASWHRYSYGYEFNNVMISKLACIGNETDISECPSDTWDSGYDRCPSIYYHSVGVNCLTPVKLEYGRTSYMGRIDVQHNGVWGAVCDDQFTEQNVAVMCSMLGYSFTSKVQVKKGVFKTTYSNVIVDGLDCTGNEHDVQQCPPNIWNDNNCTSDSAVGINCNTPVRLVNGTSARVGVAQVMFNGSWEVVCNTTTDNNKRVGQVVCRMLGYSYSNVEIFKPDENGIDPEMKAYNMSCYGNEKDLAACVTHQAQCSAADAIGVACNTDIQLYYGRTQYMGELRFRLASGWGGIRTDYYKQDDTNQICNMLGHNFTRFAMTQTRDDLRQYQYSLQNVADQFDCNGHETDIADCIHNFENWVERSHYYVTNINCQSPLRLVDGKPYQYGRVELYHNVSWKSVCSGQFKQEDAYVLCRMLGHKHTGNATILNGDKTYPTSTSKLLRGNFQCDGSEDDISQCYNVTWDEDICQDGNALEIDCRSTVRLVDGPTDIEGRVEVYYNGTWLPVCYDYSNMINSAKVICRMLGLNDYEPVARNGSDIWDDEFSITHLRCLGVEDDITECPSNIWLMSSCSGKYPLEVACSTPIRLTAGSNIYNGRVEFIFQQNYHKICENYFDDADAEFICRNLDYSLENMPAKVSERNVGTGRYSWIEELHCLGNETDLFTCNSSEWKQVTTPCPYAAVNCRPNTPVRLVDGTGNSSGRVEIFYRTWGTICNNSFTDIDASVICHMLGFKVGIVSEERKIGTGNIIIDDLNCVGTEFDVSECPSKYWNWYSTYNNCIHSKDVSVQCTDSRVRLLDGLNVNRGRVDLQFQGQWRSVCDTNFDINDAEVVCREIGFLSQKNATIYDEGTFGYSTANTNIQDLSCMGNETDLDQCPSYPWATTTSSNCPRVGINCRPHTPVRLVDGPNRYSGRVEIEYLGSWGTICDYDFDEKDAMVICRMMGFNTRTIGFQLRSFYGKGSGNITVSNLGCTGLEPDISECIAPYKWLSPYAYCDHGRDISVQCNTPVRLADGWTKYSGRVEVYYNNKWGSVCDEGFDLKDAETICSILGFRKDYKGKISIHPGAYFGRGEGDVIIAMLNCTGTEGDLFECQSPDWMTSNCGHEQDVGINCRAQTGIRIMDGQQEVASDPTPGTNIKGRVEVNYNGEWGTICNDNFDNDDAFVLCSMMGYTSGIYNYVEKFGSGTGDIIIDELNCLGIEDDISVCRSREWTVHNCDHDEDVAIECSYQEEIDPCEFANHKLPLLDYRYINFATENLNWRLNDSRLPVKWYSVGQNTMPHTPPEVFNCGTKYPIYATEPAPNRNGHVVNITACQIGDNSSCVQSYDIQVKKCSDELFTYRLGPTLNDLSGYCFGTGQDVAAPSHKPEKVYIDVKTYAAGVTFVCKFDMADEDLFYQVNWDIEGERTYTFRKGFCNKSNITLLNLDESELRENRIVMGIRITCAVRAYKVPWGRPGLISATSEPFFAGIRILTPTMTMERGESKDIELVLTVPFQCNGLPNCELELVSSTPDFGNCNSKGLAFGGGGCGISIPHQSVGEVQRLNIMTAETGQYGVSGNFEVFLQTVRSMHNPLMDDYKLPAINIEIVPELNRGWRGKLCAARNDPHMTTFDGTHYEHHPKENWIYILYINSKFPDVMIQHKVTHCTTSDNPAMCNCGVAVRAGRDVYVISVCDGLWDIGYKHCGDNTLTVKKENDMTYTIYLPYGTAMRVRIDSQPWMGLEGGNALDISIYPSLHDQNGRSRGLCGTLDGDKTNDFHYIDEKGTIIATTDRETFISNWKVEEKFNMFSKEVYNLGLQPWLFPVCTCNSKSSTPSGNLSCERTINTCTPGVSTGTHSCFNVTSRRSVRSLTRKPRIPIVRISHDYIDKKRFKRSTTDATWSLESATTYCHEYMNRSKTFSLCQKVPSTHTGISVDNCALDILLTNSTNWSSISLQSMQDSCLAEVYKNTTVRQEAAANGAESVDGEDTNVSYSIADEIETIVEEIGQTCPYNCNDRGNCTNGMCICEVGFGAYDCSLNIIKPPRIDGLLEFGLCDEKNSNCDHVYLFGELFLEANLTCRMTEFHTDQNNFQTMSRVVLLAGSAPSLMEAICPLHLMRSKRSITTDDPFILSYEVALSNDGSNFGNDARVVVYDSTCQVYSNFSENDISKIVFHLLDDFCYIEGICYENGTVNSQNDHLLCDVGESTDTWTDLYATTLSTTSPLTSTTPNEMSSTSLTQAQTSTTSTSETQTATTSTTTTPSSTTSTTSTQSPTTSTTTTSTTTTPSSTTSTTTMPSSTTSTTTTPSSITSTTTIPSSTTSTTTTPSSITSTTTTPSSTTSTTTTPSSTTSTTTIPSSTTSTTTTPSSITSTTTIPSSTTSTTTTPSSITSTTTPSSTTSTTSIPSPTTLTASTTTTQTLKTSSVAKPTSTNSTSSTETSTKTRQISTTMSTTSSPTIKNSTPGNNWRRTEIEVRLDFNISSSENLDEATTYHKYEIEIKTKLKLHYKHFLGINLIGINILSIRAGSLVVKHEVVSSKEEHVDKVLARAITGLLRNEGEQIKLFGVDTAVINDTAVVGTAKVNFDSDSLWCDTYTTVAKCGEDSTCDIVDNNPICRKKDTTTDDSDTSTMLMIWIPVSSALAIFIIATVVCIIRCNKKKVPRRSAYSEYPRETAPSWVNHNDTFNRAKRFVPGGANLESSHNYDNQYGGNGSYGRRGSPRHNRDQRESEPNFYAVPGDNDNVFYGMKRH